MGLSMNCYIFFVLLSTATMVVPVAGDRVISFMFNNGQAATSTINCTDRDTSIIAPIFQMSNYVADRNLQLRSSSSASYNHPASYGNRSRHLPTSTCSDNCLGKVPPFCYSTVGCSIRYTRKLQEKWLELYSTCTKHVAAIHAQLDALIASKSVSSSCRIFLDKTKRQDTCEEGVLVGEIKRFMFWAKIIQDERETIPIRYRPRFAGFPPTMVQALATTKIHADLMDGYHLCFDTYYNIEAIYFPCLDEITFTVRGPNNYKHTRTDTKINRRAYGEETYVKFPSVGVYNVTAVPDQDVTKQRIYVFRVRHCATTHSEVKELSA